MSFETVMPHPALRQWVRYYWLLDESEGFSTEAEPIAPDGAFEMVIHLDDSPEQWYGEAWARQASEMLVGEIQRPTLLRASSRVRCLGVHFAPGGVAAFFDEPATQLRDAMTPLDSVARPFHGLLERLDAAADLPTLGRELDAILLGSTRAHVPDARTRAIVDAIESAHGQISIDALAFQAGVSVRHLERMLTPVLGIPPKRYARVVRFHHAFRALLGGDGAAALDGYFDQSHFLRDLRAFANAPARELLAAPMVLNRHFHS